jgi:hypothetical protein
MPVHAGDALPIKVHGQSATVNGHVIVAATGAPVVLRTDVATAAVYSTPGSRSASGVNVIRWSVSL